MKNPNAIATLTVGSVILALEQLGQEYVSVHLGLFWGKAVIVAVTTGVVYVGRDGVKGCLQRIVGTLRSVWSGRAPAPPAAGTQKS